MRMRTALIVLALGGVALGRQDGIRFLRWAEIQPHIADWTGYGERTPLPTDTRQWDGWLRLRDVEIRGEIDRDIEDSISILIMFGASITTEPRLAGVAGAVSAAGDLTPAARARMEAFIDALDRADDERSRLVLQFLRRRLIPQDELRAYLAGNLRRAALERTLDPKMNRSSRSLFTGSAVEEALRGVRDQGKMPVPLRRIGILGPGLDPEYDPESYNLFGPLEASLRLTLAKPGNVEVVVMDINPWVLSHVRATIGKAGGKYAARIRAEDLNVITQTSDTTPGFDLVVAGNNFSSRSRLDQALAFLSIAQMMTSGAILLMPTPAPQTISQDFELLTGIAGAEVAAYRRR